MDCLCWRRRGRRRRVVACWAQVSKHSAVTNRQSLSGRAARDDRTAQRWPRAAPRATTAMQRQASGWPEKKELGKCSDPTCQNIIRGCQYYATQGAIHQYTEAWCLRAQGCWKGKNSYYCKAHSHGYVRSFRDDDELSWRAECLSQHQDVGEDGFADINVGQPPPPPPPPPIGRPPTNALLPWGAPTAAAPTPAPPATPAPRAAANPRPAVWATSANPAAAGAARQAPSDPGSANSDRGDETVRLKLQLLELWERVNTLDILVASFSFAAHSMALQHLDQRTAVLEASRTEQTSLEQRVAEVEASMPEQHTSLEQRVAELEASRLEQEDNTSSSGADEASEAASLEQRITSLEASSLEHQARLDQRLAELEASRLERQTAASEANTSSSGAGGSLEASSPEQRAAAVEASGLEQRIAELEAAKRDSEDNTSSTFWNIEAQELRERVAAMEKKMEASMSDQQNIVASEETAPNTSTSSSSFVGSFQLVRSSSQ